MMKTVYWDSVSGLIPVRAVSLYDNQYNDERANIVLARSHAPYKAGEHIETATRHLVIKTRTSNGIQFVKTVGMQHLQHLIH